MADADDQAFERAVSDLRQAGNDLADLEQVYAELSAASQVFTPAEQRVFAEAIDRRRAELERASIDLEARQSVYRTKIVRLRKLIQMRDEVIGRLDIQYGVMDRFGAEMEVVVTTQSDFQRDLETAQAELHR